MKLLVTTRSDNDISEMSSYTHDHIRDYAKKINADFTVISELQSDVNDDLGKKHFRIMQLNNLLEDYDRILMIDSDTIINHNCPNIFDVVPYDCIGSIYEDKGSRASDRHCRIKKVQEKFGDVGWKEGYINTGVFVVSKHHKKIFEKINGEYWTDRGYDDVHLGHQIHKNDFCIHELSYKFNHMTMFSEKWNGSPSRFESYIIHYAGAGLFDFPVPNRETQIRLDKQVLFEK